MFARPSQRVPSPPLLKIHQPTPEVNMESSTEQPRFARPGSGEYEKNLSQLLCNRAVETSSPGGMAFSDPFIRINCLYNHGDFFCLIMFCISNLDS